VRKGKAGHHLKIELIIGVECIKVTSLHKSLGQLQIKTNPIVEVTKPDNGIYRATQTVSMNVKRKITVIGNPP
jgi:hypothetical protein